MYQKAAFLLSFITITAALKAGQTVWTVFGDLAKSTGAVNLGQGFPDWDPPQFVLDSLQRTISHQYTRPAGHPPLIELLAKRYSQHLDHNINPFSEIAVTVGASQALYLTLTTQLKPGDEIILFDPFFELYTKQIALTGATAKFVPLGGPDATLEDPWALDINAFKSAITDKTKIILLNSPHNPTGKVFTLKEMELIAEVVRENPNIIVVSDEVYKYTIYNPLETGDPSSTGHYHFARLPDMWDRTITISSCGKTFSVTGWQVGWMLGPSKFIEPVQTILPCVQFNAATPIQEALAYSIEIADQPYENYASYYEWLRSRFSTKREILEEGLLAAGINPVPSYGGFFLMGQLPVDNKLSKSLNPEFRDEPYDWQYCRKLAEEYGVIGIPASPFFSSANYEKSMKLGPLARFAFCKKDATMVEARKRLSKNVNNEEIQKIKSI